MPMTSTLQKYLADNGVAYDILTHRHTDNTMNTANAAHVPARQMAKPVVLEDEDGYIMAVVPANQHVKINKLNQCLGRKLGLATEPELTDLFSDCDVGAIPPVGYAYDIDTVVDDKLDLCHEVYMESGDHEDLIHITGASYQKLMKHALHARIS